MRHANPRDQLKLGPDEMREMGYRIIDMLVDYNGAQAQFPVTRALDHATFEEILDEPIPEAGSDWQDVLEQFERQVLTTIDHLDHPRFFAYIPSSSNFVGAMADTLGFRLQHFQRPISARDRRGGCRKAGHRLAARALRYAGRGGRLVCKRRLDGEFVGFGGGAADPVWMEICAMPSFTVQIRRTL